MTSRAGGTPPCEFLPWDTDFFGVRVGRVLGHRLDAAAAREALAWAARERIACLYFLADVDDPETVAVAEAHGFGLKDLRATYQRRLGPDWKERRPVAPDGARIREALPVDGPTLEQLACDLYRDSRFYFDPRFGAANASRLFRIWLRQCLAGQADAVLVLEHGGEPRGFFTCHRTGPRQGQCQLFGVAPEARGQGLGLALGETALAWFARHDVAAVTYVTQARNVRAQRVIQRLGFVLESVGIWYHRWFDEPARAVA
jgi:GNAT superfamily N-acetyltransferase